MTLIGLFNAKCPLSKEFDLFPSLNVQVNQVLPKNQALLTLSLDKLISWSNFMGFEGFLIGFMSFIHTNYALCKHMDPFLSLCLTINGFVTEKQL